ncbi:hypothetical protein JZ751_029560 [Albula glossodonta]|uniref:Uncharacterized protein n=1 Tax=Albula glossodonta TaxID=121402 RepID=A0A8T2NBE9_9TELE|nr:hypothetical protein JZ751_029560 [Albula glossodonta]
MDISPNRALLQWTGLMASNTRSIAFPSYRNHEYCAPPPHHHSPSHQELEGLQGPERSPLQGQRRTQTDTRPALPLLSPLFWDTSTPSTTSSRNNSAPSTTEATAGMFRLGGCSVDSEGGEEEGEGISRQHTSTDNDLRNTLNMLVGPADCREQTDQCWLMGKGCLETGLHQPVLVMGRQEEAELVPVWESSPQPDELVCLLLHMRQ